MHALWVLLFACTADDVGEGDTVAPTVTTPPTLTLPSVDDVDWEGTFADALTLMLAVDPRVPWATHIDALALGQPGCPHFYAGPPDQQDVDVGDGGMSWSDRCDGTATSFGGYAWWDGELSITGDPSDAEGQVTYASRTLIADATVSTGDEVLLELDGELSDAVNLSLAPGYEHWTYTATVDATLSGTMAWGDGSSAPGGLRAGMYLYYSGGDVDALEARGNVYLPEHRLSGRFDSAAIDALFTGPLGAPPDTCELEPAGYISVRDSDAFWYDLVFQPRYGDDPTDTGGAEAPYGACDGCGTLYIRGVEQPQLEVCPDFSSLWNGDLAPPAAQDFILTLRDVAPSEEP